MGTCFSKSNDRRGDDNNSRNSDDNASSAQKRRDYELTDGRRSSFADGDASESSVTDSPFTANGGSAYSASSSASPTADDADENNGGGSPSPNIVVPNIDLKSLHTNTGNDQSPFAIENSVKQGAADEALLPGQMSPRSNASDNCSDRGDMQKSTTSLNSWVAGSSLGSGSERTLGGSAEPTPKGSPLTENGTTFTEED